MRDETYIGDGVYASFDGWMIKLRTQRDDRDDVIYLEPSVYGDLARFADSCFQRKPDPQPRPVTPDEEISF